MTVKKLASTGGTTTGQFIGQTDDAGKERVYAALGIS